jgi:hypothetical protein
LSDLNTYTRGHANVSAYRVEVISHGRTPIEDLGREEAIPKTQQDLLNELHPAFGYRVEHILHHLVALD